MTDFTTIQTTEAARFTHREWREAVVKDKAFAVLTTGVVVKVLTLVSWCEGRCCECLGLTTCEDGRTMHTRKCSRLSIEIAEGIDVTAVSANAFFHDCNTECLLLDVFETLLDFKLGNTRNALLECGFHLVAKCSNFLATLNFVGGVDSVFDAVTGNFISDFKEVFLGYGYGVVTLRLAHLSGKFLDSGYDSSDMALSEVESFDKLTIRNLISSTFDHDTLGFVTDVDKIKITIFALLESRVYDKLTINTTDANSTDSACEGNIRDAEGSRCAVHAQDISIVNSVSGKHQGNNLSIVEIAFWEKRT